jgi:hypothetical protein
MQPSDLEKSREIFFHSVPSGQAERALALLQGLEGLTLKLVHPQRLHVRYPIREYTLQGLENALVSQGFVLDTRVMTRLKRGLAYFCENVQRRNLAANEPDIKSQQAFVKVYDRHLHGDRDDTPEEWRGYK